MFERFRGVVVGLGRGGRRKNKRRLYMEITHPRGQKQQKRKAPSRGAKPSAQKEAVNIGPI